LDLGLDLRAAITPRLQLNATVNPDFGQVEADQLILNLTNQEALFPEKRPFFFQGIEAFQPVGFDWEQPNQVLFYSRRIGLLTPILGAVKVTGEVGDFDVGMLDAVVMGAHGETVDEAMLDRRLRYDPRRPLHLGLHDEALPTGGVTENYFAGVLTYKLGEASTVGARAASAVPLPGPCVDPPAGAAVPEGSPCSVFGSNAGALDWNLRTADARWVLLGQADVSRVVGGPPSRTLPDGVVIDRGQSGWGTYVQAGKVGGEPLRFDVTYSHVSPTLELNGAGYLPTQNEQALIGSLHFIRPSGFGGLHAFDAWLSGSQRWTTDGKLTPRWGNAYLRLTALLPGFHTVGVEPGYEPVYYDVRELTGRGIPFQRTALYYFEVFGESDPARVLSGTLSYSWVGMRPTPATPAGSGYTLRVSLVLRPQSRLESTLLLAVDTRPQGPRWTGQTAAPSAGTADSFLVGDLRAESLSTTFRQQLVIVQRLTLQAYGQLFTAVGHYLSFFRASPGDGRSLRFADLIPTDASAPGFYNAGLKVNVVMRWEYRLGSTLYAIYGHTSESLLDPAAPLPTTLSPMALGRGRAVDTFMVKWSYFWRL